MLNKIFLFENKVVMVDGDCNILQQRIKVKDVTFLLSVFSCIYLQTFIIDTFQSSLSQIQAAAEGFREKEDKGSPATAM